MVLVLIVEAAAATEIVTAATVIILSLFHKSVLKNVQTPVNEFSVKGRQSD